MAQLRNITKVLEGKYLNLNHLQFVNSDGSEMIYEMVSRRPLLTAENIRDSLEQPTAVSIIIHDHNNQRILLNHEFRPALNTWIYEFPGGLREDDEALTDTAKRELREETGLDLYQIDAVLDPAPTAVGFSDECVATVIGRARGQFQPSDDPREEIEAGWYSKADVVGLMQDHQPIALATQRYLYAWLHDYLVEHNITLTS